MKYILLIFMIAFTEFALSQGDAPPLLQGQLQLSKSVGSFIQSPNVSVTKISSSTALIETGNKNILTNPSFEHSTAMTGWTNSAGGVIVNNGPSSVVIEGKKSIVVALSSQVLNFFQDSSLYSTAFDSVQGLASVRILTSVQGLRVCSRQAGVVSPSLCVNIQANGKWGLYKVPFILGGTSNGISINSNGASVSGNVYIDDAFVGAVDLQATVDSSKLAGESYFAGTSGCTWTRTSSTIGSFSTTAACPGPTVAYSSMGQWQTTDADLPRQTINNLPPGVYKATFTGTTSQSVGGSPAYSINDGTTTCEAIGAESSTTNSSSVVVSCTFIYNSSGNRTFELYTGSSTNTVSLFNGNATPRASLKFQLEYFGSGSIYSSTNADTDWASCGHTAASFTGFGTPTAIETQCKRQGGDLLVKGKFTSGVPTAVEARLSLPLWNGVQLVSAGSSIIPSLQLAGKVVRNANNSDNSSALIEPSVSYFTYGIGYTGGNELTKATGSIISANGLLFSFQTRIPIEGWQQSNIIIGQFNGLESCTNTLECTDVFSAKVNSTGVVSDENVTSFINGNCSWASNIVTCPFTTGVFTVAPNCTATSLLSANTATVMLNSTPTASQVQFIVRDSASGAAIARDLNIVCQKQGVDYIGKTAKAVASDQNTRTSGAINTELASFSFGTGGATTVCSASPCTYLNQVGSLITSVTRGVAGSYTFNFSKTFQKIKCSGNAAGPVSLVYDATRCESCSSVTTVSRNTNSGVGTDSYGTFICHLEN